MVLPILLVYILLGYLSGYFIFVITHMQLKKKIDYEERQLTMLLEAKKRQEMAQGVHYSFDNKKN
jgi:hypothetical protein